MTMTRRAETLRPAIAHRADRSTTLSWRSASRYACLALAVVLAGSMVAPAAHPNIVFIVTDDQGPWAMHAAGDPNAVTPNSDRLRASGIGDTAAAE